MNVIASVELVCQSGADESIAHYQQVKALTVCVTEYSVNVLFVPLGAIL